MRCCERESEVRARPDKWGWGVMQDSINTPIFLSSALSLPPGASSSVPPSPVDGLRRFTLCVRSLSWRAYAPRRLQAYRWHRRDARAAGAHFIYYYYW